MSRDPSSKNENSDLVPAARIDLAGSARTTDMADHLGPTSAASMQQEQRDVTQARPNPAAAYHCGLAGMGKSCALGPTPSGRCCQEQWVVKCGDQACAKTCQGSGKCEVGQLKHSGCEEDRQDFQACIPIKNSWYSRNTVAINLALLTGGLLLVGLALPNNRVLFAPGSLSTSHSQILGNTTASARCSTCHPNSHDSQSQLTQEQLCMNCHQSHMKDAIHGYPHDLTAHQFARLISSKRGTDGSIAMRKNSDDFVKSDSSGAVDAHWRGIHTRCAECHQEHHADSRSLQAITDARCQACHQQQFASFSNGHPEFRKLPANQPRRIAFDHLAHLENHFPKNGQAFDCSQCHQNETGGVSDVVRSVGFQQACAGCHDNSLRASAAEGWALLQLPSLPAQDVRSDGSSLAHWPSGAQYGYDGPITLPMRLLLSGDPEVVAAIAQFPNSDLSQTNAGSPVQQSAVRTIAIAARRLILQTAEHGQAEWQRRLTELARQTLGRELAVSETELIQSMVAGLPPDLFRQVAANWFGGHQEIATGDRFPVAASLVALQDDRRANESLLDEDPNELLDTSSDSLLDDGDGDLLSEQNVDELLRSSSTSDLSQENEPIDENTRSNQVLNGNPETPSSGGSLSRLDLNKKQLVGLQHLSQGGWYLDSHTLSIRYMLRGHADPVYAAWIQFASLIDAAIGKDATHPALGSTQSFHAQLSLGQCIECHLLPDHFSSVVNSKDWMSVSLNLGRRFTHFDHRPHLTLAGGTNCQTCHRLDESRRAASLAVDETSKSSSPGDRSSGDRSSGDRSSYIENCQQHLQKEFVSIQKAQCNTCHRPGGAPEGCTQCHNYHVDAAKMILP